MSRGKPRGLRPEEEDLWRQVARTARPLEGRPKSKPAFKAPKAPKTPQSPAKQSGVAPFEVGSRSETALPGHQLAASLREDVNARPLHMDKKTFGKMKRGKSAPEARIDLHGMTVAAAHSTLIRFILNAQADGKRLVLVITGKGRRSDDADPIPTRTGILRHQLPHWLDTPPLRQAVLQVTEAHRRHGGSGAFYVYLARKR